MCCLDFCSLFSCCTITPAPVTKAYITTDDDDGAPAQPLPASPTQPPLPRYGSPSSQATGLRSNRSSLDPLELPPSAAFRGRRLTVLPKEIKRDDVLKTPLIKELVLGYLGGAIFDRIELRPITNNDTSDLTEILNAASKVTELTDPNYRVTDLEVEALSVYFVALERLYINVENLIGGAAALSCLTHLQHLRILKIQRALCLDLDELPDVVVDFDRLERLFLEDDRYPQARVLSKESHSLFEKQPRLIIVHLNGNEVYLKKPPASGEETNCFLERPGDITKYRVDARAVVVDSQGNAVAAEASSTSPSPSGIPTPAFELDTTTRLALANTFPKGFGTAKSTG